MGTQVWANQPIETRYIEEPFLRKQGNFPGFVMYDQFNLVNSDGRPTGEATPITRTQPPRYGGGHHHRRRKTSQRHRKTSHRRRNTTHRHRKTSHRVRRTFRK